MRGPGRVNKRNQKSEEPEKDLEISNDLQEYKVLSESSSVSRSLSSSSRRSSDTSSSDTPPILRNKDLVRTVSAAGSGGSGKSLESGNSADSKKNWKMDDFYKIYSCKKYISGYLYMEYGNEWIKVYAVISGEMLRVVKVSDLIAVKTYQPDTNLEKMLDRELNPSLETLDLFNQDDPVLLESIKDSLSVVFALDYTSEIEPLPPIPYTCFFSLDKYSFASSSFISSNSWVHAARLSAFDLLRVVPYIRIWSDFDILPFKSSKVKHLEWDGDCKIRFQLNSEWTDFYCKVNSAVYKTHNVSEEHSQKSSGVLSKFFHGKKSQSNEIVKPEEFPKDVLVSPAQLAFFSSISDCKKGMQPIFIMTDVSFVYALWPQSMHHFKSAAVNEVKITGNIKLSQEKGKWSRLLHPDKTAQPCSLILQSANTHESLHWVVAVLGAFALDADINSFDINAAVWSSPPTDWGDLCLNLDEVAGLSGSMPLLESFYEYYKLFNGKKSMLKNGSFTGWQRSVKNSIDTRKGYERKEVGLKINALFLWLYKLKNGEIQLPNWVETELNDKIGQEENDPRPQKQILSDSEAEDGKPATNSTERDSNPAGGSKSEDVTTTNPQDQIASNTEDTDIHLQRVSSAKRKAAKKFLLGLSQSSPKMFERSEFSDLPSSMWYEEEESRIKEREEFAIDQESPVKDIPLYEANSLLERDANIVKKSGLENFHIPEKQAHIFAENSLLDRTATSRNSNIKIEGPLLGELQKEGNKPKLEGGLLGQMDLKEKEYENFRKSGGYRATMIPQRANLNPAETPESFSKRNSSLSDARFTGQTSNNPPIMPAFDPRTSFIAAPPLDPRMSFINPALDPRMSFISQQIDPRFINQPLDPRFINQPSDPRLSFINQPLDPRFSLPSKRINQLNSLSSKSKTQSAASSESSESGNDEANTDSDEDSGTDSTSNEGSSSSDGSSSDENKNQDLLFTNREENGDSSGSNTSNSSSATSSDSDENDLESFRHPVPFPMFGPIPHSNVTFQNPQLGPQFSPKNLQMYPLQPINVSKSQSPDSKSSASSGEESPINDKPIQNDSGTESDSSASADELSSVKKPRSFVLPGKRQK